jgi:Nuclease-related domain
VFYSLIPLALFLVPFLTIIALVWALRKREERKRRSPLTAKLLRSPGESLHKEIDDTMWDFATYLSMLLALPILIFAVHLSQAHFGGKPATPFQIGLFVLLGSLALAVIAFKTVNLARRRWQLSIGYEAELAMGQELDQLMREGAVVFHDFPAEGFNVDHVLVTRGGVFAVETKGRSKPIRGQGAEDAKVTFDGKALIFPTWTDTKALQQAQAQAKWLTRWLSSAVGESVPVKAVLALPGWYVERKGRSDVMVISGREAKSLLKGPQTPLLDETLVKRIAHQLEQRCRDVEPFIYGKKKSG